MTDIVERLRAACSIPDMGVSGLIGEAAAEIERLRKLLKEYQDAVDRDMRAATVKNDTRAYDRHR